MKQLLITIAAVVLMGCGNPDALIQACYDGNIEAVKQHLADGADVNAKDEFHVTPLYAALEHRGMAGKGHKEIIDLLIANGADVNATSKYEETLLQSAAGGDYKGKAELLIAAGADVNAKSKYEETPLHHAAVHGHKEIAELLIAKGADVNTKDEYGATPLDWSDADTKEIAELLRKHGGKTGDELKAEGK